MRQGPGQQQRPQPPRPSPGRSCVGATGGASARSWTSRRSSPSFGAATRRPTAVLVAACGDGTWQGSRDEIAIRFGLLGIRVAEICRLTWSNLLPDGTLAWMGKGRRPRSARPGPVFAGLLARWQLAYGSGLCRPIGPGDPIVCRMVTANQYVVGRTPAWGAPILPDTFRRLLLNRSAIAGLGTWRLTTSAAPPPSC